MLPITFGILNIIYNLMSRSQQLFAGAGKGSHHTLAPTLLHLHCAGALMCTRYMRISHERVPKSHCVRCHNARQLTYRNHSASTPRSAATGTSEQESNALTLPRSCAHATHSSTFLGPTPCACELHVCVIEQLVSAVKVCPPRHDAHC